MRTVACLLLAACAGATAVPEQVSPTASEPSTPTDVESPQLSFHWETPPLPEIPQDPSLASLSTTEIAMLADLTLHSSPSVDYARPMNRKPTERRETMRKWFRELCARGDHDACRKEAWLRAPDAPHVQDVGTAFQHVAEECESGDMLSCGALPMDLPPFWGPSRFPDLPGATSRGRTCAPDPMPDCDLNAVRLECFAGLPLACTELYAVADDGHRAALAARTREVRDASCRAGNLFECDVDDVRECEYKDDCAGLSGAAAARGDRLRERDLLERTCQYTSAWGACEILVGDYGRHTYPEPVPGRARALKAWIDFR